MKLLQLTHAQLPLLKDKAHIIVESQEYGQITDFRFHAVVPDDVADSLSNSGIRCIQDKGRTVGFWQRLGAHGVLSPNLVRLMGFPINVERILVDATPAKISFEGDTWNDIILGMPNRERNAEIFNLVVSNVKSRKTKTGSKKSTDKKKASTKE